MLVEDKDYIVKMCNTRINIAQIKKINMPISKYWIREYPQMTVNNPTKNEQDVSGSFTSDAIDRQDAFGDGTMSMFAIGLAAFAAGAATFALIQNAQQATDNDSLKARVTSLESDQTNICTTVKSFSTADDGFTINDSFTNSLTGEQGYIKSLAAVASPTCS